MTTEEAQLSTRPVNGTGRQRRRPWFAVIAVALLTIAGFGYWRGTEFVDRQVNGGLVVDTKALDFGEVWVDPEFKWTLPLHNSTDRPIEVADLSVSCGCTSIEPPSLSLGPGETTDVRLTLDLTPTSDEDAENAIREFSVRILPRIKEDPGRHRGWLVRGTIRSMFAFTPPVVSFWENVIHGQPFPTATILVRAREPLELVGAEAEPSFAKVLIKRKPNNTSVFVFEISPHDGLPVGLFTCRIAIHAQLPTGERIVDRGLRVAGRVSQDVQVIPSRIVLGAERVGRTVASSLLVRSRTNTPFILEIKPAEPVATAIDRLDDTTQPKSEHGVRIEQQIAHKGERSLALRVVARYASGRTVATSVPILYYGLPGPRSRTEEH